MSICCSELPCKNYYSAENGKVRLDGLVPSATMYVKRDGNKVTIEGTEWEFPMSFDLNNRNTRLNFGRNSFCIMDIMNTCMMRRIGNIPEHKYYQLEELKKLLA